MAVSRWIEMCLSCVLLAGSAVPSTVFAQGGSADVAPSRRSSATLPERSTTYLHARALAGLPALRDALDGSLTDYPSARFRAVVARLVRSVYASDEGQSNKVPWTHRGNPVLIYCGEINSKNRMGGYGGWEPFYFEPAQTDIVPWWTFEAPRRLTQENIAKKSSLAVSDGGSVDREWIELLCGPEAIEVDPTDFSSQVTYKAAR